MADEASYTISLSVSKGGVAIRPLTTSFTGQMGGDQMSITNPDITTTGAAIVVAPVDSAKDYGLRIFNTATANSVFLSSNGGSTYPVKIPIGECLLIPFIAGGTSIFIKTATGVAKAEITAWEVTA